MEKKNILFIFPACMTKTFASNDGKGAAMEKTVSPPLGILYLAAELAAAGYLVDACDYNAEEYSDENLLRYIEHTDLVGISMLSFNRVHSLEIIQKINRLKPELPIIVGGPDCILHPRIIPGTRLIVCQEAEHIIVTIVETVLAGKSLTSLPGVVYVNEDGTIKQNQPRANPQPLDSLKLPLRHLLRDNKGYTVFGKKVGRNITTLITSRGCPKKCKFCAHHATAYWPFRMRSVKSVLAEIKDIAEQGYELIGIVDDNFTANKQRAKKIMEGIIAMKLKVIFAVQGRVDAADYELFVLMKKAGVKGITFGLESGNQDVLDFYNKQTTVQQNKRAIQLADKVGLYTAGLFILGAPFETKEHFQRTYNFATSLPLDITSFWVLDYTYGSELWQKAYENGIVRESEYNVPAGKERGTSPYKTEELEQIAESYFFNFYRRPSYWTRQIGKLLRTRELFFFKILILGIVWLCNKKVQDFIKTWNPRNFGGTVTITHNS